MNSDYKITAEDYFLCLMLAQRAHKGQKRRGGEDYFQAHVLPVAMCFCSYGERLEHCVALLHDAAEDNPEEFSIRALREEFHVPEIIVEAVDAITKRAGEDYYDYLVRVSRNAVALRVKVRDVLHNISSPQPSLKGLRKYTRALVFLLDVDTY